MNGKLAGKAGEMTLAGVISGQFEYQLQNVRSSLSFLATCSDLP